MALVMALYDKQLFDAQTRFVQSLERSNPSLMLKPHQKTKRLGRLPMSTLCRPPVLHLLVTILAKLTRLFLTFVSKMRRRLLCWPAMRRWLLRVECCEPLTSRWAHVRPTSKSRTCSFSSLAQPTLQLLRNRIWLLGGTCETSKFSWTVYWFTHTLGMCNSLRTCGLSLMNPL